jgi:hypothetical protein
MSALGDGGLARVDDARGEEEPARDALPAGASAVVSRADALDQAVGTGGGEALADSVKIPPEKREDQGSGHADAMDSGLVITPEMAAALPVVAVVTFEFEASMEDELTMRPG